MSLKQIFVTRKILTSILFVAIPALLFYALSVFILSSSGFTLVEILRDPAQQTGLSSFLGFVSNIGVWLWVSSAAICFHSVLTKPWAGSKSLSELMLLLGLFSLLLAVDDFFLLHDRYVYSKGIFLFYAICALAILIRHYRKIVEIDGFTFLFAGLLLASSIEIDVNQRRIPLDYAYLQLIEEGCKFVGAAIWLFFAGQAASFARPES
ncbi:MAG: oxidase [Gammaproteobacteria bacterium]|nr:oxidase [Gammaproteobacteria bacterium]MBT8436540.1 oxidase [Gammaproteobacteria bacterium]